MQPGMCTFDDPTDFSKPTAVRMATSRDAGGNTAPMKNAPVFVVVVTPIGVDAAGAAQRSPTYAANWHVGLNQRDELGFASD